MTKKLTSSEQTKQAFIEAFCLLSIQKPMEKISVQDVARKAGYHRSTFYQYFSDINELLLTIEEEFMAGMVEKRKIRAHKKLVDRFLIEELVIRLEENELYLRTLFGEHGNNQFMDKIKTVAKKEIAELSLSQGHKLAPYLIEYHLSGVFSLFKLWLQKDQDLSTEELVSFVVALYEKVVSVDNVDLA